MGTKFLASEVSFKGAGDSEDSERVVEEIPLMKERPEKAPNGMSYRVVWADGRGVQYFANHTDALRFSKGKDRDADPPKLIRRPAGARLHETESDYSFGQLAKGQIKRLRRSLPFHNKAAFKRELEAMAEEIAGQVRPFHYQQALSEYEKYATLHDKTPLGIYLMIADEALKLSPQATRALEQAVVELGLPTSRFSRKKVRGITHLSGNVRGELETMVAYAIDRIHRPSSARLHEANKKGTKVPAGMMQFSRPSDSMEDYGYWLRTVKHAHLGKKKAQKKAVKTIRALKRATGRTGVIEVPRHQNADIGHCNEPCRICGVRCTQNHGNIPAHLRNHICHACLSRIQLPEAEGL